METGRSQKAQRLCLIASAVSDKPDAPKPKPPRGPIKVPRPTRGYSNVSTPSPLYATVRPPARKAAPKKQAAPGKQAVPPAKKAAPVGEKAAAPAKKAAAKAAPRVTITLKQIAAALAEGHDLPKKQAESLLDDLVALTTMRISFAPTPLREMRQRVRLLARTIPSPALVIEKSRLPNVGRRNKFSRPLGPSLRQDLYYTGQRATRPSPQPQAARVSRFTNAEIRCRRISLRALSSVVM
jgi:hypothetical protein